MNSFELFCGPRLARVFFFLSLSGAAWFASAASLDFDKTFNDQGAARQSHYRASYVVNDTPHQIEVWREADLRLKRRTDDSLETLVFKEPKQAEWRMVVLDLKRKIRTDIERTNLYRIGHFTNWFSMAYSLSRPLGEYQLSKISAPAGSEKPLAPCQWYALTRSGVASHLCWSSKLRLPLLITNARGALQWRVTAADAQALAPSVFAIEDQGFVRNNADDDIQSD